jgi:hypothetical protein
MNTASRIFCFWMAVKSALKIIREHDFMAWANTIGDRDGTGKEAFKYETALIDAWLDFLKKKYADARPPVADLSKLARACALKTTRNRLVIAWISVYGINDEEEAYRLFREIHHPSLFYGAEAYEAILVAIQSEEVFADFAPFFELLIRARRIPSSDDKTFEAESEKILQSFLALVDNLSVKQTVRLTKAVSSFTLHYKILTAWIEKHGIQNDDDAKLLAGNIIPGHGITRDELVSAYAKAASESPSEAAKFLAARLAEEAEKNRCFCPVCQIHRSDFSSEQKEDLIAEARDMETYCQHQRLVSWQDFRRLAKEFCASDIMMAMVDKYIAWRESKGGTSVSITIINAGRLSEIIGKLRLTK